MNATEHPRKSSIIREEIVDLTAYLNNLPATVRSSGAFESYDLRVKLLQGELTARLLHDLSLFGSSKNEQAQEQIVIQEMENNIPFFKRLLNERRKLHIDMASKFERHSNLLQYSTLGASISAVASVASASSLSLLAVVGTATLAGLIPTLGFATKLRSEHKLAEDLEWMESEIAKLEKKEQSEQEKMLLIEHLSERTEILVKRYENASLEK